MGAEVHATDGRCGKLERVIVNPVAQAVTHLVVEPGREVGLSRLVPIDLVQSADEHRIELGCTVAEFRALDDAEDAQFLPATTNLLGYGDHAQVWPYYGYSAHGASTHHSEAIYEDRIPLGDVDVHRGDQVHATDGFIGSVHGLVIDPQDHHVTHVLLQEGHFWGRRQVAIPIGATSRVGEDIRVDLTRQQIEELPEVELSSAPAG